MEDQEKNEKSKLIVRSAIDLGQSFRDLTDQGKYQEVLRRMSTLGLPELILDDLTPNGNYIHPYILDVTYSYLKCIQELGRALVNRDPSSAMAYYKKAIKNGGNFWEYYKNITDVIYHEYINVILESITRICYACIRNAL